MESRLNQGAATGNQMTQPLRPKGSIVGQVKMRIVKFKNIDLRV
jgi:hypothetical protein